MVNAKEVVDKRVVYVGKTQNRVMDRFIGHRADLRGDDDTNRLIISSKRDTRMRTWELWLLRR